MLIETNNRLSKSLRARLNSILRQVISVEKLDKDNFTVSLSFVSKKTIQSLNREYRNIDKATDVLSFPLKGKIKGEVIICKDIAKVQSSAIGHDLETEISYLFMHSVLHILGYDHIDDKEKKVMREKEKKIWNLLQKESS